MENLILLQFTAEWLGVFLLPGTIHNASSQNYNLLCIPQGKMCSSAGVPCNAYAQSLSCIYRYGAQACAPYTILIQYLDSLELILASQEGGKQLLAFRRTYILMFCSSP